MFADINILLVPFVSAGVNQSLTTGVEVHQGFINAYNSIARDVLDTVQSELVQFDSYSLVAVGDSLGGSLASIAGISLKANFASTPLRMFTFGQARTGNSGYAALAENLVGVENIFRGE